MHMRAATADDWPAIWPIWHETVTAGESYTYDPDTDEDTARRSWLLPGPAEVWLAIDDDAVLGTYQLKPNQPGLGSHVANASYMVAASARGRGIGRMMGEQSLDRARALGFRAMQFNAVVATNTAAVALWRALGFEVVGTVPGAFNYRRLGYVDLLVMHRFL
jgi:L-amino acid N-acyltransferase YncA